MMACRSRPSGRCWLATAHICIYIACAENCIFRSQHKGKCCPFFKFSVLRMPPPIHVYIYTACARKCDFRSQNKGKCCPFCKFSFLPKLSNLCKMLKIPSYPFCQTYENAYVFMKLGKTEIRKNPKMQISGIQTIQNPNS